MCEADAQSALTKRNARNHSQQNASAKRQCRGGDFYDAGSKDALNSANVPSLQDDLLPPDFTVVIQGQEFHHYSQMLRSGSAYFNALFTSNMVEASTRRIVIDDCTPDEWKLVSSFFQAAHLTQEPTGNISVFNVEVLIPWFDKFMAHTLLARCDKVYCIKVFADRKQLGNRGGTPIGSLSSMQKKTLKEDLCCLLDALEFGAKHSLPLTVDRCCKEATRFIKESRDIFCGSTIMRFCRLCLHHKGCCDAIWGHLKELLNGPVLGSIEMTDGPPKALQHPEYDSLFSALVEFGFCLHGRSEGSSFFTQERVAKATRSARPPSFPKIYS